MRLIGLVATAATALALASEGAVAETPRHLKGSADMSGTTIHVKIHHNHPKGFQQAQCNPETNIDYEGNDIKNVKGRHVDQCCGECANTNGCNAWSWNSDNGGTCWLKWGKGNAISKHGVTSATVAPGGSSSGLGQCQVEKDTDYEGGNFKNVQGRKVDQCCDECAKTHGCSAWSWNSDNGGTCWLKFTRGHAIHKPGVTSAVIGGSPSQLGRCQVEKDTDYPGFDIKSVQGRKLDQCCSECAKTHGCNAWSWNSDNGGTCWLKSGKVNAVPKQGVMSGVM